MIVVCDIHYIVINIHTKIVHVGTASTIANSIITVDYALLNTRVYNCTYMSTLSIGSSQVLYQSFRISNNENIHSIPNKVKITITELPTITM